MEAIKLVVGIGNVEGKLLLLDAKNGEWRGVRVAKDPQCRVCSRRAP
jgi:hypothetical protein